MPYIFGKLWHLAIIWPIRKAFQCILQGVRILLANHTRISPTSDNDSYIKVHIVFLSRFCSSLIEPHFQNEFCKLVLPSQHHCLPTYLADSDTDRKFPGSMYSLCANFVSFPLKLVIYKILVSYSTLWIIFIGPESDHWLCLSLADSLTHSLTNSCLVNF